MQSTKSRQALWQRAFLMAALLPFLGGCFSVTHSTHYDASGMAWKSRVPAQAADLAIDPFAGVETLSREHLIAEVLLRNPSAESARLAWREALSRYPQTTALDDPILTYESAPATIGSEHGHGGALRLSQRFEWPGKQALRGAIALAQADAKGAELAQVRLHLATTTSILFDDYFVVSRALEINREHAVLVTHLRQSAEAQYTAGRGSQQDPLQADVALAIIERSRLALAAREQLISAQINGLLHRPASSSLPVAPAEMAAAPAQTEGSSELLARARQVRPELQATSHRVEARRSGVALAERAYYPDFSLAGTYNAMGSQPEDRLMIGLSLDIPIQLGARQGRVEQARAALDLARSRLAERLDAVGVEVRQARVRLEEAFAQVALYREQILPAARRHIAAAEAGYASGRNSFSDIMVAGRQLSTFEEEYAEALASTWRRRAAIERAVGTRAHVLEGGGRP